MREALAQLEKASDALDGEYAKAIGRIELQLPGWRGLARRVLLWITYATRQLSINELREAIAIDPKRQNVDLDDYLNDENKIVSVCQGLVEVDQESRVVRLVHYTTQEYFEKIRDSWLSEGKLKISHNCIAYLSMNVFEHSQRDWETDLSTTIEQYRFLEYAGKNWGVHARTVHDKELQAKIMDFLLNADYLRFSSMFTFGRVGYDGKYRCFVSDTSATHVSSYFDLYHIVEGLIQRGEDVNHRDSWSRTPLSYTAQRGYTEIAQLLLAQPDIELNQGSPLGPAAGGGHIEIVQLLLAQPGTKVNGKDQFGDTPLWYATHLGHTEIVQLLLAHPDIADQNE